MCHFRVAVKLRALLHKDACCRNITGIHDRGVTLRSQDDAHVNPPPKSGAQGGDNLVAGEIGVLYIDPPPSSANGQKRCVTNLMTSVA